MKLAVQLYTLRDILPGHVESVLEHVARLGYQGVEFAGFYEIPSRDMKSLLNRLSLTAVASHTSLESLLKEGRQILEYNRIIGNRHIVIPWTNMRDKASYQEVLPSLKKAVALIVEEGMIPVYHNHAHEFAIFDGKPILDHLLDDIPALRLELDIYWAVIAGIDPIAYLNKRKDRLVLIHAKDMITVQGEKTYGSVGEGEIDYKAIYGMKLPISWWIVENDKPQNQSMDNIANSIHYLKSLFGGK